MKKVDTKSTRVYLLERLEAGLLAQVGDVAHDELLDFGVIAQNRERSRDVVLGRVVLDVLDVGHDDADDARLEPFAVDEDLRHVLALRVDVLDLLGRDVFALR